MTGNEHTAVVPVGGAASRRPVRGTRTLLGRASVLALTAVLALLGACREGEQGRQLVEEKGVYPLQRETALDAVRMRALTERTRQLRDIGAGNPFGGAAGFGASPTRPPAGGTTRQRMHDLGVSFE